MDLEEFVAQTLEQIVAGVVRAQAATHASSARIHPIMSLVNAKTDRLIGEDADGNGRPAYEVEFDVAITVTKSAGSNAGLKAKLHVIEAGVGGKSSSEDVTASRVSFKLPIVYPVHSGARPETSA